MLVVASRFVCPQEKSIVRSHALFVPVALLTLAGCSGETETQCTSAPQSDWQDAEAFQEGLVADGYRINEFKITEGDCYEIYGFDPDGTKVEIYFDPVDGSIVKREED